MRVNKEAVCGLENGVDEQELALINQLSRKRLTADEVYTFGVRLCDNEVDRDFERFDLAALEKLAALFVGKSGIFDHQWTARGQAARIYRTELVREEAVRTVAGEPYCYLKGFAYMLRTEGNRDLIAEIEGGIKKEVSVGCAVERTVCSICGHDMNDRESCVHVKGRWYDGQLCYGTLADPTDAYEWSFVAVPAQPKAGVVKSVRQQGNLKEFLQGQPAYLEELARLEKEAEMGRTYLARLRRQVTKLAGMAELNVSVDTLKGIVEKLEERELVELKKAYERRLEGMYPPVVQLGRKAGTECREQADTAFLI